MFEATMSEKKETAFSRWYANHKEQLSEKRKQRYKNDPVYRQACLDRKAKQSQSTKAEPVDPMYTHNFTQAAEQLGVSLWTLRSWRTAGYFPEPHEHNKGLFFTANQVALMSKLAEFFQGKSRNLTDEQKAELQNLSDLIRANWS